MHSSTWYLCLYNNRLVCSCCHRWAFAIRLTTAMWGSLDLLFWDWHYQVHGQCVGGWQFYLYDLIITGRDVISMIIFSMLVAFREPLDQPLGNWHCQMHGWFSHIDHPGWHFCLHDLTTTWLALGSQALPCAWSDVQDHLLFGAWSNSSNWPLLAYQVTFPLKEHI